MIFSICWSFLQCKMAFILGVRSYSSDTRGPIWMKLWGCIGLTLRLCNVEFLISGSDPEPEVARFPITSYMFYEKNISKGGIETKVDISKVDISHSNWFTRSGGSLA